MMEKCQPPDAGPMGQLGPYQGRAMAPVLLIEGVAKRVLGVEDKQIGVAEEVNVDLAGRLVELLGRYRSVNADGSDPAIWLLYASRHTPHSVRVCGEYLTTQIRMKRGPAVV